MSKKIMVTKTDGSVVPFNESKVRQSLQRVGTDENTINDILRVVKKNIKSRMSTQEIYKMVNRELGMRSPWIAARYHLREAIVKLGPAGFNFEKYVAAVLSAYGYKTDTPDTYQGACVWHEIDVTAEKDGRNAFIEAKFRRDFRAAVNIKDTLATWARFLDLVDGSKVNLCPHFDEVWIVTNARFTDQSLEFGHCKNMKLIGWNHPKEKSFAHMVDVDALYPVTTMKELRKPELQALADANLMLCRDVIGLDTDQLRNVTGLGVKRLESISKRCKQIVHGQQA